MALVKYGEYITAMSGSVGGTTHARNRYGFYVRNRTKPVNPNTALQVAVRAKLAELAERWSQTLTQPQRDAWDLYGDSVVVKNALGEDIHLTGFNHYMRSNVACVQCGLTVVDDGPTIFEVPEKDPTFAIVATESTQDISYTFDALLPWAAEDGAGLLKYQGKPMNGQRTFFAGPWRYHGVILGATEPPTSPDLETDPPYAIAAGQHQWCYARIRRADGRLSEPFRADSIVVAGV